MRIRIFGTEIYMTFLFFSVIAFLLVTDRTGLVLPTFFCVLTHEAAHLFAMWLCDCQPKKVRLSPARIEIVRKMAPYPKSETLISAAGPLANLLLCGVLYINYRLFGNETVLIYCALNAVIGGYNLLPVSGLDGGTVLYSLIARKKGAARAAVTLKIITALSAAVLLTAAIIMTVKGKVNLSLYIIAVYLFIGVTVKM